jgi:hypothetical protein
MGEYRYKVFTIVTSLSLGTDTLSTRFSSIHQCVSPRKMEAIFEKRSLMAEIIILNIVIFTFVYGRREVRRFVCEC